MNLKSYLSKKKIHYMNICNKIMKYPKMTKEISEVTCMNCIELLKVKRNTDLSHIPKEMLDRCQDNRVPWKELSEFKKVMGWK